MRNFHIFFKKGKFLAARILLRICHVFKQNFKYTKKKLQLKKAAHVREMRINHTNDLKS